MPGPVICRCRPAHEPLNYQHAGRELDLCSPALLAVCHGGELRKEHEPQRSLSMAQRLFGLVSAGILGVLFVSSSPVTAADNYTVDSVHSGVTFKILHYGL